MRIGIDALAQTGTRRGAFRRGSSARITRTPHRPATLWAVLFALALSLLALASELPAAAEEPLALSATMEPARATVGAHLTLTIVARHPTGTRLEAPDSVDDFAPLELIEVRPPTLQASTGTPTWVWATLLMAAFAGLTVVTMALVRLPILRTPPPLGVPAEAVDETARRELDDIASAGLLDRGELKEYYRRIASCLRQYLSRRFDIPAAAMTPQELEQRLEALALDRQRTRLTVNLLQQCQAVQFAQHEPARERAEADLSSAYEVVTLTQRPEEARAHDGEVSSPT